MADARAAGQVGCVPLLPGYLFLAAGTFQHHLMHGSLSYREAADVDQVLSNFSVCSEARDVLNSRRYQKYFDNRLGLLPDRSVITFRHIENHQRGCPEIADVTPVIPVGSNPASHVIPGPSPPSDPPPQHLLETKAENCEGVGDSRGERPCDASLAPAPRRILRRSTCCGTPTVNVLPHQCWRRGLGRMNCLRTWTSRQCPR